MAKLTKFQSEQLWHLFATGDFKYRNDNGNKHPFSAWLDILPTAKAGGFWVANEGSEQMSASYPVSPTGSMPRPEIESADTLKVLPRQRLQSGTPYLHFSKNVAGAFNASLPSCMIGHRTPSCNSIFYIPIVETRGFENATASVTQS